MFAKINLKALLLAVLALGLSATLIYSYNPSLACSEHQGKQEEKQPEAPAQTSAPDHPEAAPNSQQPATDAPTITPEPTQPTPESLQQGKILLETRCSTCHPAPRPNTHTVSEWPPVLKRMGAMASLKEAEVQLIQQYIEDALKNTPQSDWDQPKS